MAEKNFLSWVGFKGEEETAAPSENAVERIRQLESQLADLRSRRDITSLTKEEFEILATETAMSIIRTAQQRESRATAQSTKMLGEATARAKETLEGAESKAKAVLSGAESRGRKYLEAAESEAAQLRAEAARNAEQIIESKKREAGALLGNAKREAERIIVEATSEIANYRSWLTTAISESERLYRIQTQSLSAAESAISQSRARLQGAFEKLASLQSDIDGNLTPDNRPRHRAFAQGAALARAEAEAVLDSDSEADIPEVPSRPARAQKPAARTVKKRPAPRKIAKKPAAKKRK
jgi:cell division septum initiation protein DivIVA